VFEQQLALAVQVADGNDGGVTVDARHDRSEDVLAIAPASAEVVRFDNYSAVIQAFISGQTDLMVVGNDVGAGVLARQEGLAPEQKFQLLTSPSHIALNQGEPALKAAVDAAIAAMLEDGRLNAASEAWLATPLDPANLVAD